MLTTRNVKLTPEQLVEAHADAKLCTDINQACEILHKFNIPINLNNVTNFLQYYLHCMQATTHSDFQQMRERYAQLTDIEYDDYLIRLSIKNLKDDDLIDYSRKENLKKALRKQNDIEMLKTFYSVYQLDVVEIANAYGVKPSTIKRWVHDYRLFRKRKPPVVSPSKEVLYDLYVTQDLTPQRISEQFNVCNVTVIRWLARQNITKDRSGYKKPEKAELEALYKGTTLNFEDIAAKYQVPAKTVRYWILGYYKITRK